MKKFEKKSKSLTNEFCDNFWTKHLCQNDSNIRKFHQTNLKKTQKVQKAHMNMNTRTPKNIYMKFQVRTTNLN